MNLFSFLFNLKHNMFSNNATAEREHPVVQTIDKNLKLLCIADTHSTLKEHQVQELNGVNYDACFLLGDISHKDLQLLLPYLDTSKTYGVLGNHDDFGLLENNGITNINMKTIDVNGVTILGFQGSNRYKEGNYPMYTQEEAFDVLKDAPYADILVSHDSSFEALATNSAHCGLKAIRGLLKEKGIPLHIHGHIHDRQQYFLDNGTSCICIYKAAIIETNPVSVRFLF